MNEADFLETANSTFGLLVEILSFYMTVTSAYLIAAFLVGERLTRSQITIISTLYVFMTGVSTYASFVWGMRGIYYMTRVQELDTGAPIYANTVAPMIVTVTLAAGIVACLKFMWDVRHPKTE